MRIVAGEFRGRPLTAPAGENTRPTADRVREALMSSLQSMRGALEGAVVLDAFAGSGALGLEALSRGAAQACFFERDRDALRALADNVSRLGLDRTRARIVRADVLKNPSLAGHPSYDLVFLDPPYALSTEGPLGVLARMRLSGTLAPDALVVYEHAAAESAHVEEALAAAGLPVRSRKKYGITGIVIAGG